jgi:hypothetical protein
MHCMFLPLGAMGSHTEGASSMVRDGGSRAILPRTGLANVPGLFLIINLAVVCMRLVDPDVASVAHEGTTLNLSIR